MQGAQTRKFATFASVIIACLVVLACTTATFVIQQYDGDPLPADRIAVLRIQGGSEGIIAELDGELLNYQVKEKTDRVHIEMLPGKHRIGIAQDELGRVAHLSFQAEAGRTYQAFIVHNRLTRGMRETWSAAVYEIDAESDAQIRDVSIHPNLLPPPTAPVAPAPPQLEPEPDPATSPAPQAPSADAPPPAPTPTQPPATAPPPANSAPPATSPATPSGTAPTGPPPPASPTTPPVPPASTPPPAAAPTVVPSAPLPPAPQPTPPGSSTPPPPPPPAK